MVYNIQLIAQGSIYMLLFILNFIVAIPIGVNMLELNHQCMLYNQFNWISSTRFFSSSSSSSNCNFPVYVAVIAIFYSLILAIIYLRLALKFQGADISNQMWVWLFTVISSLFTIFMLVASCILSVGIKETCDGFMKGKDKGASIHECSDIQFWRIDDPDASLHHVYNYPKISEVASWVTFLTWMVQTGLYFFRWIRNRGGH